MDRPQARPGPSFTQPVRQIVSMLIVIAAVAVGAWAGRETIAGLVTTNPWLNAAIVTVFLLGAVSCLWQAAQLVASVRWIGRFAAPGGDNGAPAPPGLLAPLAALLAGRGAQMQISTISQRSILDSVATRMDEAREVTRYLGNLLIFLGLLGTFYGLATTVPAMVETIRNLAPAEGESGIAVFGKLMAGLEGQLGGMGTAFSSSLLGLAGSLVVGLLDLFAGHGQNRFYRELEEWLSTITRLGLAGTGEEGEGGADLGPVVAALEGFAERTGAQIAALQAMAATSEAGRAQLDARLGALAATIDRLAARIRTEAEAAAAATAGQGALLERLAEGQQGAAAALLDGQMAAAERVAAALAAPEGGPHVDAESRMRLRSIDVQLLRILEEIAAGRQESLADLRGDLAALTAAIGQLARAAAGARG